jgi:hypothetical protein
MLKIMLGYIFRPQIINENIKKEKKGFQIIPLEHPLQKYTYDWIKINSWWRLYISLSFSK